MKKFSIILILALLSVVAQAQIAKSSSYTVAAYDTQSQQFVNPKTSNSVSTIIFDFDNNIITIATDKKDAGMQYEYIKCKNFEDIGASTSKIIGYSLLNQADTIIMVDYTKNNCMSVSIFYSNGAVTFNQCYVL